MITNILKSNKNKYLKKSFNQNETVINFIKDILIISNSIFNNEQGK